MVDQNKNTISASVLPDLSGDLETAVLEEKSPVVEESTSMTSASVVPAIPVPTAVQPVVVEDLDAPAKVEPVVTPVEVKPTQVVESTEPASVKEEIPLEKKNAKLYKIGTILLIIILFSTIGVFYMRTKTTTVATKVEEAVVSPTPEVTPEATPKAVALEKEKITLEVFNGTSTSGLAGKTAKIFENLGYKIEDVGNADDVSESQLYVKTEFATQLEKLLEDVKEELDITKVTKEIDDLDVTARIILGGE